MCRIPSKKYICLKKLLGVLRGGVGWGLGLMLARRGDRMKLRGRVAVCVVLANKLGDSITLWTNSDWRGVTRKFTL